ncbi:BCL2/adenovirus E1B 19 kDa protein-interacting protein 3 isoform X2 [Galendromus occidentalis]|uniref:BCL2/adenovirus E1B 19 kDa protein-interacting protein 3 isoform X2 n=1 Tax=Galendromus occidentalis TaxID=34638 RepID=A0AAJ6W0V1_9ACAR|nr:BCL2/adenovirus E1B 19 kDa protein-interacting protein 3 isoform X2 [Galendromus occidentalis]
MTSTPPNSICEENLTDSWVELYYAASHPSTPPIIPPYQIEQLLLEAQRESNQSSLKNSGYCSPRTPKSLASNLSMHDDALPHKDADPNDWLWDWSGRPDSVSARDLKYGAIGKTNLSLRHSRMIRKGVLSEMVPLFVMSNIISIIIGAGIGLFFGKRWSNRGMSFIGLD